MERGKFRCGAATSGDRRRVCPRPFAVRNRRKPSGVDRGYADPVVVHEYVPENNALHLIPCQFVRGDPVDFFLLQCCKKAFHSRVVKAMSRAAEALNKSCLTECGFECFAGVLTSAVTMKDRSADLFPVLQSKLRHGSGAEFLFHIAVHCYRKYLAVVAIENCRQVQLSVTALYFGNVGK